MTPPCHSAVPRPSATGNPRLFWLIILLCATLVVCFGWAVSLIHIDRTDHAAGPTNLQSLRMYGAVYGALWLALSGFAWRLTRCQDTSNAAANPWVAASVILTVAVVVRLGVVVASSPQLSDDIWRYILDGRQFTEGVNPYAHSPQELIDEHGADPILNQINHPHLVTIYQPTSQYIFSVCWWNHIHELDPWADKTFRLTFVLFDLLIIVLLLWRLHREGRTLWWAGLYAWNPLPISEVAGSGHQDVIGIMLLMAALSLVDRGKPTKTVAAAAGAGCMFAAAVAVKPIILPLCLPLAWRFRNQLPRLALAVATTIGTGMLLYLPFILWEPGMGRLFDTAQAFVTTWSFNASLYDLAMTVIGRKSWVDPLMGLLMLAPLGVGLVRHWDLWKTAGLFLMVSLLVSSTVHPWYLLWALAFVPIRFNATAWVWSLTIVFSYTVLGDVATWALPTWVKLGEYAIVYAVLIWQVVRSIHRWRLVAS